MRSAVGLIGLGAMGRGVARNLIAKGFHVIGHDIAADSLTWLQQQGGTAAGSLAALARDCELVILFVVDDRQTEQVLFGDGGLAAQLRPGAVVVTCSTQPPAYVRTLGERLAARGIGLVDAPVTGGRVGAERGTLTLMVSGAPAQVALAEPALRAFSARLFVLGDVPGMGAQMKVINQLLCGVHLVAAAEAMALAKRHDLPLDTVLEILKSGAGSSWMLGDRGPRMAAEAFDDVTSAVDIFVKDLGLVIDAARAAKLATPLAHAAFLECLAASARGRGRLDDSAVVLNYTDGLVADDPH